MALYCRRVTSHGRDASLVCFHISGGCIFSDQHMYRSLHEAPRGLMHTHLYSTTYFCERAKLKAQSDNLT